MSDMSRLAIITSWLGARLSAVVCVCAVVRVSLSRTDAVDVQVVSCLLSHDLRDGQCCLASRALGTRSSSGNSVER